MTFDTDEAALKAVERKDVLLRFSEGPVSTSEIEEIAGVSSSTAYRIVNSFEEKGFIRECGSQGYRITPVGEAVASEVERFYESVGTVADTEEIIRVLDEANVGIDPGVFKSGKVVRSERERPYEPARRFVELFRGSDKVRLLAVSSATPIFTDKMHRMIADGKEAEIICTEEIVEANLNTMSEEMLDKLPEHLSVFVHEDPPVTVALFEDRVGFGGHDPEKGTLDVFAHTEDDRAYSEAQSLYGRYRDESERFL